MFEPDAPFIKIGERTNVLGSARFARLVKNGRYQDAVSVAREEIRGGARMIDVNVDDVHLDSPSVMARLLEHLSADPEVGRAPVMIDSAHWEVIEAGLQVLPGKGVVNSLNLKDGEEELVRRAKLARHYGAAVVVLAIDAQGLAMDRQRKVDICLRAHRILTEQAGLSPGEIILDPGILPVGTGMPEHDDYAVAYLESCRALKRTLPVCLVSGGVSNLSFAYRGLNVVRAAMHAVFLSHAIPAGMDMGIVNITQLPAVEEIPDELRHTVEDVILNRRPDATQRLLQVAQRLKTGG